jgi:DNA-binding NarL/FixJ family response regulator
MAIKVVIADDHEVFRLGLKNLLAADNFKVVGEAASGQAALKMVKKQRPDLVILDVRMPDGDGLECLGRIKLDYPDLPVIMLSGFENPTYVARAAALGAAGYLSKSDSSRQIITAFKSAAAGESIWSRELLRKVSGSLLPASTGMTLDTPLTPRENEVLKQLAFGLTNKEIAQSLGISYETVKEHVQHVLRKLNVTDRTQAAVWAVRNNLV